MRAVIAFDETLSEEQKEAVKKMQEIALQKGIELETIGGGIKNPKP